MGSLAPEEIRYKDIDWLLDKNDMTSDIITITNSSDIKQSVRCLVNTLFYERLWEPKCGSYINSLLFSNYSQATIIDVQESVENLLQKYEPRITVNSVNIVLKEFGKVDVVIKYTINSLGRTETFVYSISRVR